MEWINIYISIYPIVIMVKKTISITIDVNTYLSIVNLKASGKEINISQVCEETLNSILNIAEKEQRSSDIIEKELEEKKREILNMEVELNKAKQEEKKTYEEELERAKSFTKAKISSGVLDFD